MQAPLKKCIFHLAWSPDTLPTTDAIVPLQEYLDSHLVALNTYLIPKNFHKVLNGVWEVTVYELGHQMDGGSGDTKMSGFYERLYEALELLVEFFHADGNGLPPEILTGSKCDREGCRRSVRQSRPNENGDSVSIGKRPRETHRARDPETLDGRYAVPRCLRVRYVIRVICTRVVRWRHNN